ncbi:MAG: hypothetical protein WCJ17_04005, partial [bacterium]
MIRMYLFILITLTTLTSYATDDISKKTTCTDTIAVSPTDLLFIRYPYRPARIGTLVIDGKRSPHRTLLFTYNYDTAYDGTFSPSRTASLSKSELDNNTQFRLCMYKNELYLQSICKRFVIKIIESGEFEASAEVFADHKHLSYFNTLEPFILIDNALRRCAQIIKDTKRASCEIHIGAATYSVTEDTEHNRFYAVKHLPGNRVVPEAIQLTHLLLTEWITRRRPTV